MQLVMLMSLTWVVCRWNILSGFDYLLINKPVYTGAEEVLDDQKCDDQIETFEIDSHYFDIHSQSYSTVAKTKQKN